MSTPTTLPDTLASLIDSVDSTLPCLPDKDAILPPENGISLLDVKNDLLLSYLHNLTFLMLLRLRANSLDGHAVVSDLIRLRVLLERGVKPLEAKLKYQIDKVVAAATRAEEAAVEKPAQNGHAHGSGDRDSDSGSDSDAESDSEVDSDAAAPRKPEKTSDLAFRPNPASLLASAPAASETRGREASKDGIYRPPRIAPTAMPTPDSAGAIQEKPRRSTALDDFVASELSAAPLPEPSIGSTIAASGRVVKTARDRKKEQERQEYEESNFVRLPKPSKKEQRKANRMAAGRDTLGGEDWTSFAGDMDRLTKGSGKKDVLSRSRKRGLDEGSSTREIGAHFEARKRLQKKRRT